MLITKTVMIKWNSKIKKHYVDLGYEFTKMKDSFVVNVNDLTDGSAVMVDVECDYCKNVYQKHWCNYILENKKSLIHKDCCKLCTKKKIQESSMTKYGVPSVFCLEEVKDRIKETNLEKYGCENVMYNDIIREKALRSLCDINGIIFSKQQEYLCKLLDGKINCKYGKYCVDILLDNNIYIEYDGGGHYLSAILGSDTIENIKLKDINREKYLENKGLKLIRIISSKDELIEDFYMKIIIYCCKKFLIDTKYTKITIDLDNNSISSNKFKFNINFKKNKMK